MNVKCGDVYRHTDRIPHLRVRADILTVINLYSSYRLGSHQPPLVILSHRF